MDTMKNNELYLKCDCGSEVLQIEQDEDLNIYYLAIYYFQTNKMSWRNRMRLIWKILTTGTPYHDQIVLTKEELEKVNDIL